MVEQAVSHLRILQLLDQSITEQLRGIYVTRFIHFSEGVPPKSSASLNHLDCLRWTDSGEQLERVELPREVTCTVVEGEEFVRKVANQFVYHVSEYCLSTGRHVSVSSTSKNGSDISSLVLFVG